MRWGTLILIALLGACATQDPLWIEQRAQERYEALVVGCKQVGGVIELRRDSATRVKLNKPPTRWEMNTAKCVTLY